MLGGAEETNRFDLPAIEHKFITAHSMMQPMSDTSYCGRAGTRCFCDIAI